MTQTAHTVLLLCEDGDVLQRIAAVTKRCGCDALVVEDTMAALSSLDGWAGILIAYFERVEPLHLRFVKKVSRRWPGLGIVVIGEGNTAGVAVDAMQSGADYYVATAELEVRMFDALEGLLDAARPGLDALPVENGRDAVPVDSATSPAGLRDALRSLMVLSRDAMSALDQSPTGTAPSGMPNERSWFKPGMTMRDLQRRAIEEALLECDSNRTRAAGLLQISIRTLHRKIREYDL